MSFGKTTLRRWLPAAALALALLCPLPVFAAQVGAEVPVTVRTARAKGVSSVKILFKHALRNAILPVVTYVGPMLAGLMTGSFVVEKIFSIPGLGRDFVSAITNRDYMMIMGTTILLATLVIVANVIVDILYKIIDPRIKLK